VTGRARTLGELDRDVERLARDLDQLQTRLNNGAYVRADLHNEQINNLRSDISGIRTMQMWVLGILASILVSAVVAGITAIAQGRLG
jgi:Haemolysin XhlA